MSLKNWWGEVYPEYKRRIVLVQHKIKELPPFWMDALKMTVVFLVIAFFMLAFSQ